jgi:serine/threonine protein kinase
LKCVETIHSHNIIHLAIDSKAFYYDHETKPTDWRLGNFGHAKTILKNTSASLATSSAYTAPEILNHKIDAEQESADLWSTGCVIYTVATGGLSLFENDIQVKNLATFRDDLEQHIKVALRDNVENPTFKYILDLMLRVDPHERKSVIQALDFWNGVYNMEG